MVEHSCSQVFELCQLSIEVVVNIEVLLVPGFHIVVLGEEDFPVSEVSDTKADPVGFGSVGGTDALFGGANELFSRVGLMLGVSDLLHVGDEVCSVGNEEPVLVTDVVSVQLFEFVEKGGQVDHSTVT